MTNPILLPAYSYRVTIFSEGSAIEMGFSAVSGLKLEQKPIVYKHGMSYLMGAKIIPGMTEPVSIVLKRGMAKHGLALQKWFDETVAIAPKTSHKRDVVIDLYDAVGGDVSIRWTVRQAMPTKLEATELDASSNNVMIESLSLIAHELVVSYEP